MDVIGLDWELIHDEACRWEHVVPEAVERRLVTILDGPTHCPTGTRYRPWKNHTPVGTASSGVSEPTVWAGRTWWSPISVSTPKRTPTCSLDSPARVSCPDRL